MNNLMTLQNQNIVSESINSSPISTTENKTSKRGKRLTENARNVMNVINNYHPTEEDLKTVPVLWCPNDTTTDVYFFNVEFNSKKSAENFKKFQKCNGSNGLFPKLINGIPSFGNPLLAIPRIDWEKIENHPMWKNGNYENAVLDSMGLKWDKKKKSIIEK